MVGSIPLRPARRRKTGYVWDERYLFHDPGFQTYGYPCIQPFRAYDNPTPKHRLHSLVAYSGLLDEVTLLKPRKATVEDLARVHTREYIARVQKVSRNPDGGAVGDEVGITVGGYDIAALAAGAGLAALDAVMAGHVENAYVMVRPPGHHALPTEGMGFCVFNNIAVCATYARVVYGVKRIAIFDYDVHHGNGTQEAFYYDPNTLVVDVHEHNNYPLNSGLLEHTGGPGAEYSQINIPVPAGSGRGCYEEVIKAVKLAINKFQPELILVSSGYDANFNDPLASLLLSSEDFRSMAQAVLELADAHCQGRCVFFQEGGYSETYVPFCGLAVLETLAGVRTAIADPFLPEVNGRGYQALQPHQAEVICQALENIHKMPTPGTPASATAAAAAATAAAAAATAIAVAAHNRAAAATAAAKAATATAAAAIAAAASAVGHSKL